jgi:hypothetical protein
MTESPQDEQRRDQALESTTREHRRQIEDEVAVGDYGTPMDQVFAELETEEAERP